MTTLTAGSPAPSASAKRKRKPKDLQVVNARYVKSIGRCYTRSGRLAAARKYLGPVSDGPEAARIKAAALKAEWLSLKATGAIVWPKGSDSTPESPERTSDAARRSGAESVRDAAKQYCAELTARADGGQIVRAYATSQRHQLDRVLDVLIPALSTEKTFKQLDERALLSTVLAICSRPKGHTSPHHATTQRISPVTARSRLKTLKWFLDWAAETERWNRPGRFYKIFKENKPVIDKSEQKAALARISGKSIEADYFSIAELTALYCAAADSQRLKIALSLNCGFANKELDTLRQYEIKGLASDSPSIERFRNKTNVYARWPLWSETATLLAKYLAPENPEELALLTRRGSRLIEDTENGRRDAVRSEWVWVYKRLPQPVRWLSFKYLRKTGAKMIRRQYGAEVASMYVSHGDTGGSGEQQDGQLAAYASRDWDKLAEAVQWLRLELEPVFASVGRKALMGSSPTKEERNIRPK